MELKRYPRVVILGSAGFVGFHLARHFVDLGVKKILLVDNFIRGKRDEEYDNLCKKSAVSHLTLDLAIEANLNGLFSKDDVVINCVALNGTQNFYSHPFQVLKNSAIPSINIPFYAAQSSVSKYFYLGSSESYAGGVNSGIVPIPTPEEIPLVIEDVSNTRWSYAISKTIGESACFAVESEYGLKFQILRIHNVYGPRMGHEHVIPDLIRKFKGGNFGVHGMNETRSFLFIDDFLAHFDNILESENISNKIVNIGSEAEVKVGFLAFLILKAMNINEPIHEIGNFPGSVSRRRPDISKLKELSENIKEISLELGISKTVEWYSAHVE